MIRLGLLSLAALAAALPVRAEEGGAIRGGEHDGFTRLVLTVEPTTEWSLESGGDRASLRFPGRTIAFATDGVFAKIPRSRVRDVTVAGGADGTVVEVALGCDCRLSTSFVGARYLALDIADRDAAPASVAPAETPAARAEREAQAVVSAEDVLIRQIERAADQGLVRFADIASPAAAPPRPRPAADVAATPPASVEARLPGLERQEQISATTVFDRDGRAAQAEASAPVPGACLPDATLDVAAWSNGTSFSDQLAALRRRLVGEFDAADPQALRDTARLYLRFGLGAEAEATLAAFPDATVPDRAALVDLARATEGRPVVPEGPLSVSVACPGLHGLWLALGGSVPVWRDEASFAAVQASFAELPPDLRARLAPVLIRRLLDEGHAPEARVVYLTAVRPGETPDAALRLAGARLAAAEGRATEAARTMAELAGSNAAISIDALSDLIRVALDAHLPIPEPVATDLAAAALQYRGSDRDARLRGLLAETLARRGDLAGAVTEARQAIADLGAADFGPLAVRLIAEANPAEIGQAAYAETALGARDLVTAMPAADPARVRIAERLVGLGLPDPALALLAPAVAAGDEAARLAAARAELSRGDAAAARRALGPLASTAAIELRALALAQSGAYGEAQATLDAAGLHDDAGAYAWASGDWQRAGTDPDAHRAAMARYMAGRSGGAAPEPAGDPAALTPDAAFLAPLPPLETPSLGAARTLLATGGKVGDFVEGALAKP